MDGNIAKLIIEKLSLAYPTAKCELEFSSPFELLVATILSAQCTDKRVNEVTGELFKTHNKPEDFASLEYGQLEDKIFSCGFYRNKAKNIIDCSRKLLMDFGGQVPDDFDTLLSLPGVGRKTANVVMANAFGGDNIAVDTHVFRVSRRLGFSDGKTPFEVEKDLMQLLDKSVYSRAHHLLIFHGRYCCRSQNPKCGICPLGSCRFINDENYKEVKHK